VLVQHTAVWPSVFGVIDGHRASQCHTNFVKTGWPKIAIAILACAASSMKITTFFAREGHYRSLLAA
jgi:hypothetical protein